ncbi:hypothetical protein H5410_023761 [Solanum commersonii]|uniref:DUF4283 domain-containing protein n=1 Tax=Solanum commersonii TaxID=4109 RepID=A0A9J5ZJQ5_SOLCO|nr:hypothetical protein H5410_023761 [Solanum commersonii]
MRFDQYEDFVLVLSLSVNYLCYNGEEHQYRVFPWSIGYNPEEMTLVVVWISLPNLSPYLFAKKSMLSIPSTFVDEKFDKLIEVFLDIVYDNLPLYCNYCKHQGHDEDVDQRKATALDQKLVAATTGKNHVDSMDIDTCNIEILQQQEVWMFQVIAITNKLLLMRCNQKNLG